MPWTEATRMQQRARFLLELSTCFYSMSELCHRFGISRKTGYKWAVRYEESEVTDLGDRSRRPKSCPFRTSEEVEAELVALRRQHPFWGPRKLRAFLNDRRPEVSWPAASTIGDVLKRHGLVHARRRPLRPVRPAACSLSQPEAPNDLWTGDFKGQFLTGDHRMCYPLTVVDAASRFVLGLQGLDSVKEVVTWPQFERLFREYGLPSGIRTDNGSPFASTGLGHLSRLSVRWLKLGIRLERITPGHPEQNGSHERMHRTLKAETTRPPAGNALLQQARFEEFRRSYNEERPHEGLGQKPPASRYEPSRRPYPEKLPEPEYPGHYEVRSVQSEGFIYWRGHEVMLSKALRGEQVGLEEVNERIWAVNFCAVELARFHEAEGKLF